MLTVHGYPPEKFGGTETYTRWLARAMTRRGHRVCVFTRTERGGDEYETTKRLDDRVEVRTVKNTYSIHNEYELHYRNPHIEPAFIDALDEFQPDIAHFTYLLGGLSASFARLAKSRGIKTVATLTDFHHLCAWGQLYTPDGRRCEGPRAGIRCAECFAGEDPYAGAPRWKKVLPALLGPERGARLLPGAGIKRMNARLRYLRETLNSADKIIFPTKALMGPYRNWGVGGIHLPFGLDTSPFDGFERKPSDKTRFVFIGQLSPHKGLHMLTAALRDITDLENWSLDVYAARRTEDEKRYLDESLSGIVERVAFRGTFDPSDIGKVYENADVLVVPSLWAENSPLVILYAIHTRTSLVSSDIEGVREVAGDWGFYYPPEDRVALRDLLRRIVSNRGPLDGPGAPVVPGIDEHAEIIERIYTEK